MTYYSNLRFFDKAGSPCNFSYDSTLDLWTGTMYFPRTSVGLLENQHLFLLENVLVGSTTEATFPVLGNLVPVDQQWKTRWENDDSILQIFTYVINSDDAPLVEYYEELAFVNASVPYTFGSPDNIKIISSANSTPLQINIAFTSDDEYIYERTLIIEDLSFATPKIVAKITFYGETIGEDERFRLVLENFGRTLNHQDELMFSNSDINEPLPDWINLNNKRKELLLAGEDIYPYIGSYKALINVIKFFGYQDLKIKEYWLNIDSKSENYKKFQFVELENLFNDGYTPKNTHQLVPNASYKKTSMFGLYYDITVATGDVDQFGVPITANEFPFTNEEVLIKLFALKKKLMEEFLPLNAKIVDIAGEGIYFEKYAVKSWSDPLTNFTANVGDVIDFTCNIELGYIRDLRKFQIKRFLNGLDLPYERFTNTINPYTFGQAYPSNTVQTLLDSIEAFYTELQTFPFPYDGVHESYKGDEPGIIAGCPIILQANIDAMTWDDMNISWDDASYMDVGSPTQFTGPYTWDTIDFVNYYEIEWIIEKNDPIGYSFSFRGPIKYYYRFPHFLPYTGKYKVTCKIYDMYNHVSNQIKEDFIEVQDRELEIAGFCRFRNFEDYSWDTTTDTWDDLGGSTWHFPIEGTSLYDSPINEKLFTWARYKNQEDQQILNESTGLYESLISSHNPNAIRIGTRNLNWQNMDMSWDEMYHSTWEMYDYHGEFLGGYRIFDPEYGDSIQIDDYDPFYFIEPSPSVPLTLQEAVDQLNASTNPGIAKFNYVVRFQPLATPTLTFIHACAKFPGAYGWCFVKMHAANSPGIYGDKYSFRKPTWLETIIIDNLADAINVSQNPVISVDKDLMFLDVPLEDLIMDETSPMFTPRPDTIEYWIDKEYKFTEAPSSQFPYGERRGELPSWFGTGAFTNNDLRIFTKGVEIPLGVPLFLIHGHSEIPGKTNTKWIITNELNGQKVIEAVGKPFLIINFIDSSIYTVECYVTDSNGNETYTKKRGFIKVSQKANMYKPQNVQYA